MKLFVDLHIHSCLSPCSADDMTPYNICGMAHIKGLDAIALTDHNCGLNLPYAKKAADHYGLLFLPGLEVTTREEVHILCYFTDVGDAVDAGEFFKSHLPKQENVPAVFGEQWVVNETDEHAATEKSLLIGATSLSLSQVVEETKKRGGVAVPAHVNRGSNGLLINLGFFPPDIQFETIEAASHLPLDEKQVAGKKILYSSDAHTLGDILEPVFSIEVEEKSVEGIFHYLEC